MIHIELVYINHHSSRFIFGNTYYITYRDQFITTFLDKNGVLFDMSNEILSLHFKPLYKFREERIDSILEYENKED